MEVDIPDAYCYQFDLLHLASNPPLAARQELVSCGLRQATPDIPRGRESGTEGVVCRAPQDRRLAPRENAPPGLPRPRPGRQRPPRPGAPRPPRRPTHPVVGRGPADADCPARRGRSRCFGTSVPKRSCAGPGPSGFGTEVPKQRGQRGIAVIANYLPEGSLHLSVKDAEKLQPATVEELLETIHERLGGALTWSYHGQCLAVHDGNFPLTEASAPPADLVADFRPNAPPASPSLWTTWPAG